MSLQSIREFPVRAPVFCPMVSTSMTRHACHAPAAVSFADWIENRWNLVTARPSHARMMFRQDQKPGGLSVAFRILMGQAPGLIHKSSLQFSFFLSRLIRQVTGLLHKSSLQLAFFRNPAFFLSRRDHSSAVMRKAPSRLNSFNLRLLEKYFGNYGDNFFTHTEYFRALSGSFAQPGQESEPAFFAADTDSQRLGWIAFWTRSLADAGLPRVTRQFLTALRALRNWTMTVVSPPHAESRLHFHHFLRNSGLLLQERDSTSSRLGFPVMPGLAHWSLTSFQQPTILARLRWPPRAANGHDPGGAQRSRTRMEFRGPEMTPSLPRKPPSLVYSRLERPDVNAIYSGLDEVKKSISEIRLPAVPSAPEVDIQRLTRHVYDHFERELRIERERRGR